MEWDNVGLLAGEPERTVKKVLVALDITPEVVEEAQKGEYELIVAHHPVMNCHWNPVQTVRTDTPQGRLLINLLRSGISAICMHTNLDRTAGGVNDCLTRVLELSGSEVIPGTEHICRMGSLEEPLALPEFARRVCHALKCNGLRYADAGKPVSHIGVGGGACAEYAKAVLAAGCDTFVTADIRYHDFLDAAAMGLNIIDAGHFPTEDPVCYALMDFLRRTFPALTVEKSAVHREIIQYIPAEF